MSLRIIVCIGSASSGEETPTDSEDLKISVASSKEVSVTLLDVSPSSQEALDVFVTAGELGSLYLPTDLAGWVSCLRAGGDVSVHVLGDRSTCDLKPIHTSFLLAGLAGASERREDAEIILTATRKLKVSTSAPLVLKSSTRVVLDDLDDDLIDEDNLLQEEGEGMLAPPPAISEAARAAADDCGGRKPCDNCTCGRAERETGAQKKAVPTSSCGNCALGDAFRCAGCPFLGKPAFKPGEEHLVLELTDDF